MRGTDGRARFRRVCVPPGHATGRLRPSDITATTADDVSLADPLLKPDLKVCPTCRRSQKSFAPRPGAYTLSPQAAFTDCLRHEKMSVTSPQEQQNGWLWLTFRCGQWGLTYYQACRPDSGWAAPRS